MKANELMIGDWVYYTLNNGLQIGTVYNIFQRRVDIKPNNKTAILCYDDDILQIEPIPLTAEILEKNGFVKNVWNIYTAPTCCLSVERVKDYFFLRLGTFQLCKIKYVHELQNFLRDFKTNKEITL